MRFLLPTLRTAPRPPDPERPHRVPEGVRVYAVGDVHGRADLLERLLAAVAADAAAHSSSGRPASIRPVLVFLGDYVDRGPDSRQVVERLANGPPQSGPLAGAGWVALRGNHEDTLLRFLDDPAVGRAWFRNGGLEAVRSYAGALPEDAAERPEHLRDLLDDALPAAHRLFLEGLPLTHVEGDYLFVHAGLRPGVAVDEQDPADLLWIRDEFIKSTRPFAKMVVHGHTIFPEPDVRPNRIGVDTGAYRSGRLTACVLEGAGRRFLATEP